ncbi:LysR family transcriptional regulator [Rhodococcus opacus]|uniref:LysR family transcriptional regulator n=1 Tax=Rhodococcus opacus TaxID=37919 RepID=UPI000A9D3661|nr:MULTISPECIES: LysR family transcriptional regulator [Rhodococcus]MBA8961964.1 DNA-binding transcriptional LysR family regulator [Rhodococcus opacus]MBP2209508.1 DNA-binding transcriptional LysR family regulator [Rhodococcus opacus]MDI9939806.1 LysR family transcriptional regulator [Rhodococcus sp. IEGM 1351]UNM99372.1 LysR family transcriptional regulator [Rhodococcus opacus]UZG54801.1 LysR family transcriptional regulator [Rhodococcus opacus]
MNTVDQHIDRIYIIGMADVDLNLIRTFVLLYETRSVTRTAELLFITQPSVSHSLRRLRRQFNDDLFIRSSDGLAPTVLAASMYPQLHQALEVIDETVSGVGQFDAETSDRTFRICATDLGEISLLPGVLAALETRAPGCAVQVTPLDFASAAEELRQGRADAVICTPRIDAPDLRRDPLFREGYLGLCALGHPRIGVEPGLDDFLAERHIVVDAAAGHVDADQALARMGRRRDIAVRVPHFAVLPELVAQTRHLAVVPSRVAELFTRSSPVRTFALPVEIPNVEVSLFTVRRALPSPGVDWLRELIADVLQAPAADWTS